MKKVFLSLAAIALVASTYSCRETTEIKVEESAEAIHTDAENNLEKAGDAINEAAEDTKEALNDAGDAVNEAAQDVKEEVKDATDGN